MFTMLLNHIANIFLEPGTLLFEIFVDVGYFTAITMCYFLVEGYGYTRSKEKYGKRLLLFAAISEIPFCLAFTEEGTISFVNMNMMFTLFLCFLILVVREKVQADWRRNACIIVLVVLSIYSDWALLAPLFTLWFATCGLTGCTRQNSRGFHCAAAKEAVEGVWKRHVAFRAGQSGRKHRDHVARNEHLAFSWRCGWNFPFRSLHYLSVQRTAGEKVQNLFQMVFLHFLPGTSADSGTAAACAIK